MKKADRCDFRSDPLTLPPRSCIKNPVKSPCMTKSSEKKAGDASVRSQIPQMLRGIPQWTTWAMKTNVGGKPTKVPAGSTLDPRTMQDFRAVRGQTISDSQGIGFIMTGGVKTADGSTLIAFDMDACRNPKSGKVKAWARTMLTHYGNSYTEVTPSGAGLRLWIAVVNPPKSMPIAKVPYDAPPGVNKTPEVQTFGLSAGYVTISGDVLEGSGPAILTFDDLEWFSKEFSVEPADVHEVSKSLPVGEGKAPSAASVFKALKKATNGFEMLEGDWQALELPSASELWWRLTRAALRAAGGHGQTALEVLMNDTAFGRGDVDSRDPARYQRAEWVAKDLARIVAKTDEHDASTVFADLPDYEDWKPPHTTVKKALEGADGKDDDPWLMPAGAHRRVLGKQRFLIYKLLPQTGVAQFFGDPGCGKTPFAVSLALHVALGLEQWLGRDVENPGHVVYMAGEDPRGVSDRLLGQLQHIAPGDDLDDVPRVWVTTRPGQLSDPKNAGAWVRRILKECGQIALLIVDTQNRNFGTGNENSTEDMSSFINSLQYIARKLGCLVLLVHHTGHTAKERARGSSAMFAALDAELKIEKTGSVVTLKGTKNKNWEDPEDTVCVLEPVVIDVDEKGRDETAITLVEDEGRSASEAFEDVVDEKTAEIFTALSGADGETMSEAAIVKATGLSRKVVRTRLELAIEAEQVDEVEGVGRAAKCYQMTEEGLALARVSDDDLLATE